MMPWDCWNESGVSGVREMQGLLIAVQDTVCRKQMAETFIDAGYNIIVTNSTADAEDGILKKTPRWFCSAANSTNYRLQN